MHYSSWFQCFLIDLSSLLKLKIPNFCILVSELLLEIITLTCIPHQEKIMVPCTPAKLSESEGGHYTSLSAMSNLAWINFKYMENFTC